MISAENRPGGGATIRFTLPRDESPALPDVSEAPTETVRDAR